MTYAEPRYLQPHEYSALLRGATHHPNHFIVLRDQALLATFLGTGARVSELIHLDLKDLDIRAKRIRLLRKGVDVQTLPLSDGIVSFQRAYLKPRRRRAHCRAVFVSIRDWRLTQQSNGENLQTIRVLMNHKSLSTTARYLHTQDAQLSVAVNGIVLKAG